jgi:hypothetical protein
MKEKMLISHKFYDEKSRRLSVYGIFDDENILNIYVLTCSKNDIFCKKLANKMIEVYFYGETHPEIYQDFTDDNGITHQYSYQDKKFIPKINPLHIKLDSNNKEFKKHFMQYCYDNFYTLKCLQSNLITNECIKYCVLQNKIFNKNILLKKSIKIKPSKLDARFSY